MELENAKSHFEEKIMPFLNEDIDVEEFNPITGKYILYDTQFGTIDFFPKKNKLLIRQENKWLNNATLWIKKNLK